MLTMGIGLLFLIDRIGLQSFDGCVMLALTTINKVSTPSHWHGNKVKQALDFLIIKGLM